MCNTYTNEHFWIIDSNTSKISQPYFGQPCQCGTVTWQAAQQSVQLTPLCGCGSGLPAAINGAFCSACHADTGRD